MINVFIVFVKDGIYLYLYIIKYNMWVIWECFCLELVGIMEKEISGKWICFLVLYLNMIFIGLR